jgi:O-antigen/teichoic acid export membrane protein
LHKLVSHLRFPLYHNAYALMISTTFTSGFGLVYWILAARYYPADTLGLNAAVVSALTFLAGVAQHPFMNALLRFLPRAGTGSKRLVLWSYGASILLALLVSGLFLLSINVWSPALNVLRQDQWLAMWFLLGVVAWCLFSLQDNVLTGLRQTIFVPIENVPYAIAKIGLLILFASTFTNFGILASWTLPIIAISVPVNYLIFSRLIPQHVQATKAQTQVYGISQIAYYVVGNYIGAMFLLAATRLLPVLVTNLTNAEATAYFYLPWTIATSLKLIGANMTTSFTVEVATDNTKLRAYSYRFLLHTIGVLAVPILLLLLGAPYVLGLSGENYAAEGTLLLRLLTLAAVPNVIISLYLGTARIRQQVSGIILMQFVFCVLTLGLSYFLVKLYGITGVGIAILGSETGIAVALLATSLRPTLAPSLVHSFSGLSGRLLRISGEHK